MYELTLSRVVSIICVFWAVVIDMYIALVLPQLSHVKLLSLSILIGTEFVTPQYAHGASTDCLLNSVILNVSSRSVALSAMNNLILLYIAKNTNCNNVVIMIDLTKSYPKIYHDIEPTSVDTHMVISSGLKITLTYIFNLLNTDYNLSITGVVRLDPHRMIRSLAVFYCTSQTF